MLHAEIIQYFGNKEKAAAACNVGVPTIERWKNGIPLKSQASVNYFTKGKLKVDEAHVKVEVTK